MIRAALAIMAGILCSLCGVRCALSLRQEAEALQRWQQLLQTLALILGEGSLSLPDALLAAADGHGLPDRIMISMAQAMKRDPLLTLSDAYAAYAPPGHNREFLERLFARLGRGTMAMRQHAAEQAGAEAALLSASAAQRTARDAKLFQTLGFTGGACLALLLL